MSPRKLQVNVFPSVLPTEPIIQKPSISELKTTGFDRTTISSVTKPQKDIEEHVERRALKIQQISDVNIHKKRPSYKRK